jgi:hypothetical protein
MSEILQTKQTRRPVIRGPLPLSLVTGVLLILVKCRTGCITTVAQCQTLCP